MSVVGFDIGNQSCYIAVARQGGIETITNDYSLRATPTCVAFSNCNRILGVAARQQILTNMSNTILSFKNLIGRRFRDPIVNAEVHHMGGCALIEMPDGRAGVQVEYLGKKHTFSAEQIMAMMLYKLKEITETYLHAKMADCVISVPSSWTDQQRRAMLDAAQIVGLNVLRLINENTSVALNYGIYKQDLPDASDSPRLIAFVDGGHSSTQASIAELNKGKLKILGTICDQQLGGRDFDLILQQHFSDEFNKKFKVNAANNKRAWLRLGDECEKVKKQMSANSNNIPLSIECFMNDKDVNGSIKRADFESLCQSLFIRLENLLQKLLTETKLKASDVSEAVIVGGSSRIPMFKQIVQRVFGSEPSTTLNQDEAVCKGCALQCAILSPTFRVREFSITDLQPYSVKLMYTADKGEDGEMEVFPERHAVPFSKMLTFFRLQPFSIEASYSYPNHVPYPTTHIGRFKILGIQPAANGESRKVKVKVRINPNGVFLVSSASMLDNVAGAASNDDEAMEDVNEQVPQSQQMNGLPNATSENQQEASNDEINQSEPMEPNVDSGKKDDKRQQASAVNKVKSIDLQIESVFQSQMSSDEMRRCQQVEQEMNRQDLAQKEKADAKNALEEYVYEMRDKIGGDLVKYINEQDREVFQSMLQDVENWLYDEGSDQSKHIYVDRLNDLKKYGDPVVERYQEAQTRPKAFDSFASAMQLARKAFESYVNGDEQYAHIDSGDMEKVRKAINEKQSWWDEQVGLQNKRPLHQPPAITTYQIEQEKETFNRIINPILSKPKPRVDPPPPSPPQDPKGESPAKPKRKGRKQQQNESDQEEQTATMDVD